MFPPGLSLVFLNSSKVIPELKQEFEFYYGPDEEKVEIKEGRKGDTVLRVNSRELEQKVEYQEMIGVAFQIINWEDREYMLKANGLSLEFANQDFLDRIGPEPVNPGKAVELDESGVLKPYLDEEGKFSYTYSERMCYQLPRIIQLLKDYPDTRQAYMAIWQLDRDVDKLESGRVPCSLGYHFFLRDGELSMLYSMRSLEVSTCIGYDIYTSSRLLEYVAEAVGAKVGFLQFWVGSLHRFKEVGE
jgi:thymidylate synthase